nr:reverse transcriptase domain-containing protein [Tanacetum cinerariifolium]
MKELSKRGKKIQTAFISRFFTPDLFDLLLGEIQAFSQHENESITDDWLCMKEMLRKCHDSKNVCGFLRKGLFVSFKNEYKIVLFSLESWDDMITGRKEGSSKNTYSRLSGRGLSSRFVGGSLRDVLILIGVKSDFSNGGSLVSDSDSKFSSAVIAMNSSNSAKSFSLRMVLSMKWRISHLRPEEHRNLLLRFH